MHRQELINRFWLKKSPNYSKIINNKYTKGLIIVNNKIQVGNVRLLEAVYFI